MGKTKILIVDDDRRVSSFIHDSLERCGNYDVTVINDPLDAMSVACEFMPNLILLDVIMPDKDGGTLAAEMRDTELLQNVPIIFLTSIIDKDQADEQGGRIGSEHFLAKPCSVQELVTEIERVLSL